MNKITTIKILMNLITTSIKTKNMVFNPYFTEIDRKAWLIPHREKRAASSRANRSCWWHHVLATRKINSHNSLFKKSTINPKWWSKISTICHQLLIKVCSSSTWIHQKFQILLISWTSPTTTTSLKQKCKFKILSSKTRRIDLYRERWRILQKKMIWIGWIKLRRNQERIVYIKTRKKIKIKRGVSKPKIRVEISFGKKKWRQR